MEDKHYIEFGHNKNGDVKVEIGGMNFKEKMKFIYELFRFNSFNVVIRKQTILKMASIVDKQDKDLTGSFIFLILL